MKRCMRPVALLAVAIAFAACSAKERAPAGVAEAEFERLAERAARVEIIRNDVEDRATERYTPGERRAGR